MFIFAFSVRIPTVFRHCLTRKRIPKEHFYCISIAFVLYFDCAFLLHFYCFLLTILFYFYSLHPALFYLSSAFYCKRYTPENLAMFQCFWFLFLCILFIYCLLLTILFVYFLCAHCVQWLPIMSAHCVQYLTRCVHTVFNGSHTVCTLCTMVYLQIWKFPILLPLIWQGIRFKTLNIQVLVTFIQA